MALPRIAFATPSRNAWSETFISAHLKGLKEVVLVFSDGSLPYSADGKPMLTATGLMGRMRNLVERRLLHTPVRRILRDRIKEQLRRSGAQVLFAEYGPTGAELVECTRAAGIPLVVHFHGFDAHSTPPLEKYEGYRELLGEAAAIVVVSRAMRTQLLELGAPPDRLHHISCGVDAERFTPTAPGQNPPHFVAVGRFTDKKAPHLSLLAFREAWLQRPDARLTMIGLGELWEAVRQLVIALGLEGSVDLPGLLPPEQVAERLRGARAFVQHSLTTGTGDMEGTPVAVLEAMASGIPVVSTFHAGIPDVVAHGESGLLSPEFDISGMAAHLVQLIDHPEQADAMGKAGRGAVLAHHRMEDRIGALQAVLEQAVARAEPRSGN
ncbi:MAG: glycosyltransferase [Flavobacteriales bacterium]|nr:glycosyltransferase [Flavobacteriales bacterium]MBK9598204.1 glycosyltransferase [Flavobacteriales bacterium]